MRTCPICGRQYSAPPATSRADGSDICPVCGAMESIHEPDGFVLIYKRLDAHGKYQWPRNKQEAKGLTWQQFDWLMSGLDIEQPKTIKIPSKVS